MIPQRASGLLDYSVRPQDRGDYEAPNHGPPVPKGTLIVPVCVAQALSGVEPRPAVIQMVRSLPEFKTIEEAMAYYDTEAEMICSALCDALPQGTADRIMVHFMKRKLSGYRGVMGS